MTRRATFALLCGLPLLALAGPAPTPAEAEAALRRDLSNEARKRADDPIGGSLLASLQVSEVLVCAPQAAQQASCLVRMESPFGRPYLAVLLQSDADGWRIVPQSDAPPPAPTLAQAQALLAAESTALALVAMQHCDVDRDSGAVECEATVHADGQDSQGPLRFGYDGGWRLLPEE